MKKVASVEVLTVDPENETAAREIQRSLESELEAIAKFLKTDAGGRFKVYFWWERNGGGK